MKSSPKILFEDSELCVVSKAPRVHFDEVFPKDTPWQAVHRLDFETSGCLLFAVPAAFEAYRELFSKNLQGSSPIKKTYLAGSSARPGPFKHGTFIEGWILSRYRSSKKVQFKELDAEIERLSHRTKKESEHFIEGPLPDSDLRTEVARKKLGFTGHIYQVELITGARHQIRAFFESKKAPLVGDPIYGEASEESRLELHAWKLEFKSPITGREYKFCDE
jgi:23S rRNA-/tRNA-specific pseudouridylate synthase